MFIPKDFKTISQSTTSHAAW